MQAPQLLHHSIEWSLKTLHTQPSTSSPEKTYNSVHWNTHPTTRVQPLPHGNQPLLPWKWIQPWDPGTRKSHTEGHHSSVIIRRTPKHRASEFFVIISEPKTQSLLVPHNPWKHATKLVKHGADHITRAWEATKTIKELNADEKPCKHAPLQLQAKSKAR